jgi:hypothetical protein
MKYLSMNEYCREKFGVKLYRLSVDGGFTCPNRDGTKGAGGCIFCTGSGEFCSEGETVSSQLEKAKKLVEKKNKGGKYISYFGSFTNTYAPVPYLKKLFYDAIKPDDILVLSVATRPDCLPDETISLLSEINKIKPVWVELGLQTSSDDTAEKINRRYKTSEYSDAVTKLKDNGIYVITHLIFGLPGENRGDMMRSVKFAVNSGTDGIKIHCLYVSENTELAKMYERNEYRCLGEDEYISLVINALKLIPPDVAIHRLTGDGDKRTLIAPEWTKNKKEVLNRMKKAIGDA